MTNRELAKPVRPPRTKKHLGKNVRQVKPFVTTPEVFQEALSVANGLPDSLPKAADPKKDPGLERTAESAVKPEKSSLSRDRTTERNFKQFGILFA